MYGSLKQTSHYANGKARCLDRVEALRLRLLLHQLGRSTASQGAKIAIDVSNPDMV
jgi:hypothetical protein